jgi:hypothetical protein
VDQHRALRTAFFTVFALVGDSTNERRRGHSSVPNFILIDATQRKACFLLSDFTNGLDLVKLYLTFSNLLSVAKQEKCAVITARTMVNRLVASKVRECANVLLFASILVLALWHW